MSVNVINDMKIRFRGYAPLQFVLFSWLILSSCTGQDQSTNSYGPPSASKNETGGEYVDPFRDLNVKDQLMLVVRQVFEDSRGSIWIVGDDVFCFDGDSLFDFTDHEMLQKTVVRKTVEDLEGNLWLGTNLGIIKYAPASRGEEGIFTRYSTEDGLIDNDVWSMTVDHKGKLWIGTLEGVNRFDPTARASSDSEKFGVFTRFDLPETEEDPTRGVSSPRIIHSIMEDSKGRMWFASNGGAFIYDQTSEELSHMTEQDGLCHQVINDILEDQHGNIWFATHHNGVCYWDGERVRHVAEEAGLDGKEVWSLYEDRAGNIWFPVEHEGVYRYNASVSQETGQVSLTNFSKEQGLPMGGVHRVVEDKTGMIWLGGFGGVYRYDGQSFVNMTREALW